jgi:predicted ATPase
MQVGNVERKNRKAMNHVHSIVADRGLRDKWSRGLSIAKRIVMHTHSRLIVTTPHYSIYCFKAATNHGLLFPSAVPL